MTQLPMPDIERPQRTVRWGRWLSLVLLLATFLNYSGRFAFTENSSRIQETFETNKEGYGEAAGLFALGFAFGGLLFGILADAVSVRLLYPLVVVVWSLAGISSGLVGSLFGLGISRFILGLFEAGHWPCALRTTQRSFKPAQRTLANSILQSGASLGAVATPLLIVGLYGWDPTQWKLAFFIVGGLGLPWVMLWLLTVKESDVRQPVIQTDETDTGEERELVEIPFYRLFLTSRWWVLLFVVVCINTPWHYIRVWMPDTLQDDHGYSPEFVGYFRSLYYMATFFGSLVSGWLTGHLAGRGWNVHRARLNVFLLFALLTTLSIPAAFLSRGPLLLGSLLVVAFGSLGLFPIYYSLNQELSAKHQGKVGGSLGFCTWGILFFMHPVIGRLVDANPSSRPWIFAAVGLGPLLAYAALRLCWGQRPTAADRV